MGICVSFPDCAPDAAGAFLFLSFAKAGLAPKHIQLSAFSI
jgi:hypothetical protein